MVEKNDTLEMRRISLSNPSLKATRLSELHMAGLVPAMCPAIRKCANTAPSSDSHVTAMLDEVMRIYNSYFSHIRAHESTSLLEAVGGVLSADAHYALPERAASAAAVSIAEKMKKFDNPSKPAYGSATPSTCMFEMLAEVCRYAKGGTFKAIGFSIYDAMKDDPSRPALSALQTSGAADGAAFQVSQGDIAAMAHLSRSLPLSSEYSWLRAADAISKAASFSNDFLLKAGAGALALLDSAVEYMSRNANALRRGNADGIEKIAISLFASRESAQHQLNGDGITAGIELSKKVDDYKDNPIGLRIFSSALGVLVSQLSGEKISIEISNNGFLYLKCSKYLQIGYFANRLANMRKKLGSEFKDAESIATSCLEVVVKSEGFGSNDKLLKKIDALRKGLYFGWIGSVGDDTRIEMDDQTAAIMEMLKASKKLGQSAFPLFVDSVSLIYGLGVHVEKVGSFASIARNV